MQPIPGQSTGLANATGYREHADSKGCSPARNGLPDASEEGVLFPSALHARWLSFPKKRKADSPWIEVWKKFTLPINCTRQTFWLLDGEYKDTVMKKGQGQGLSLSHFLNVVFTSFSIKASLLICLVIPLHQEPFFLGSQAFKINLFQLVCIPCVVWSFWLFLGFLDSSPCITSVPSLF